MRQKILDEFEKRVKEFYSTKKEDDEFFYFREFERLSDEAFKSVTGFALYEDLIWEFRKIMSTVEMEQIREKEKERDAAIDKVLVSDITSKEDLIKKFEDLLLVYNKANIERSNSNIGLSFHTLYDKYHKPETHDWFKELVIHIVSSPGVIINRIGRNFTKDDSVVFKPFTARLETTHYKEIELEWPKLIRDMFFVDVIGCKKRNGPEDYIYGNQTLEDGIEFYEKLKKYKPGISRYDIRDIVDIPVSTSLKRIPNLDVFPVKGDVKAPIVSLDFLNEKLIEYSIEDCFERAVNKGDEFEVAVAIAETFLGENPDCDPECKKGGVTSSGIPYYLVKGVNDGGVAWTYGFIYWNGEYLDTYIPIRGNSVHKKNRENISELSYEYSLDFFTGLFKGVDGIVWPKEGTNVLEMYSFFYEIEHYVEPSIKEMLVDFEGSIEVI